MNLKRVVLVISLALGFTGCAAIRANQTHWTEQLLAAAGFHVESVATAEDLAHLRTLKPRKVVQERRGDERRYVYADLDVCTCLYVGDEQQSEVSGAENPEGDRGAAGKHDGVPESLGPLALALIVRSEGWRSPSSGAVTCALFHKGRRTRRPCSGTISG